MDGVGFSYADHLTSADLHLLSRVSQGRMSVSDLRRDPKTIPGMLGDPRVFDAVFGDRERGAGHLIEASPFLVFAVAVHRASQDLHRHVSGSTAPQLVEFLGSPARRLFLAELLASFTRISGGGSQDLHLGGEAGWAHFTEVEPLRLADLVQTAADDERPGLYRRLGDVLLYLSGVFPSYTERRVLAPIDAAALLQSTGIEVPDADEVGAPSLGLFEHLGARCYHTAWRLTPTRTQRLAVVVEVADRFRYARRALNLIADRYLFA